MSLKQCYHCGKKVAATKSTSEKLFFCCAGCETVYRIIHTNDLGAFYTHYPQKGLTPKKEKNYAFLENETLWEDCVQFKDGNKIRVKLSIPSMHCSACIWILEHLSHIEPAILHSHVTFSKRRLHLIFDTQKTSMKDIAILLDRLGYPADFTAGKNSETQQHKRNRSLWLKIGIAGFAFGNSMFFALPTYFEKSEPWLDELRPWFDALMFFLSIPVVFYAARHYFINSYKSISNKLWSLDIPIALGISVLFVKSTHAAFIAHELPYFDSLTGLVFFLLLGQYMQQSVYALADFERGYRSFFPVGVSVVAQDKTERIVPVEHIKKNDCLLLRPEEIIPVDGIVFSDEVHIDYSFVTGESAVVIKKKGASVFAGGKIQKQVALIQASKSMDKSLLLQLWQEGTSSAQHQLEKASFADRISRYFTPAILSISTLSGIAWLFIDATRAVEVIVAVLIVACPCALALSSPFILGNMVRYFGKLGLLLKNNAAIENIAATTHWVFDKTGTLSDASKTAIHFHGNAPLSMAEKQVIKAMVYPSTHPMSKAIFRHLKDMDWNKSLAVNQEVGKGISTQVGKKNYRIGSAAFVGVAEHQNSVSGVYIAIDGVYRGCFHIRQAFRPQLAELFQNTPVHQLSILSGDSDKDQTILQPLVPKNTTMRFNQSPFDKVDYIASRQDLGEKVLMVGDGLNDAGALVQSDAGIAVNDGSQVFTPKCDAIISANRVVSLPVFWWGMKKSIRLVYISFGFSLLYNCVGIGIAVVGGLNPIIAAILMPLSSMSVVGFASLSTAWLHKKITKKLVS